MTTISHYRDEIFQAINYNLTDSQVHSIKKHVTKLEALGQYTPLTKPSY